MSENQKKVWVTGASSGIGKAVAEKFAKEKWKVAISARRVEILNETQCTQIAVDMKKYKVVQTGPKTQEGGLMWG